MWDKKDMKAKAPDVKPADNRVTTPSPVSSPTSPTPPQPVVSSPTPPSPPPVPAPPVRESTPTVVAAKEETVKIGRSIVVKGEISGAQDLIIEGQVEGKIDLRSNQVTIGQNGRINGEIMARHLVIFGQVTGNTYVEERLEIRASGSLRGDIIAPRLIIEDGAFFKGSVEMDARKEGSSNAAKRPDSAYETVGQGKG